MASNCKYAFPWCNGPSTRGYERTVASGMWSIKKPCGQNAISCHFCGNHNSIYYYWIEFVCVDYKTKERGKLAELRLCEPCRFSIMTGSREWSRKHARPMFEKIDQNKLLFGPTDLSILKLIPSLRLFPNPFNKKQKQ